MRKVDLATMPIYVRAGSIIPGCDKTWGEPVTEPTTLKVYRGASDTSPRGAVPDLDFAIAPRDEAAAILGERNTGYRLRMA